MKKKMVIGIGVACLTAGIGLAGCGASSNTGETTETTTTAEATTTSETTTGEPTTTTTTEAPTTTTTEAPTTTSKAHPEDDQIMHGLRDFYNKHEIINGNPKADINGVYSKFAIEDFDGDGENELALQYSGKLNEYDVDHVYIYEADNLNFDDFQNALYRSVAYKSFDDVTFRDNGVAYIDVPKEITDFYPNKEFLDDKYYYILSNDILQKLNYNLNNFTGPDGSFPFSFILNYTKENGIIEKTLGSGQEAYFDPVVKTQEQYEADKAILYSGNVMDIQVKDFTAENIGL